jgi:hypothetical protein
VERRGERRVLLKRVIDNQLVMGCSILCVRVLCRAIHRGLVSAV